MVACVAAAWPPRAEALDPVDVGLDLRGKLREGGSEPRELGEDLVEGIPGAPSVELLGRPVAEGEAVRSGGGRHDAAFRSLGDAYPGSPLWEGGGTPPR